MSDAHPRRTGSTRRRDRAMNSAAPHRSLPRNDERRARRGRKHARQSYRRDLDDASQAMPADGWLDAGVGGPSAPISAASPRAASPPPRRRGSCRRCASSTSSSMPRACAPTIRPGTLDSPRQGRSLPKTMSEAETGRLLDRAAPKRCESAGGDARGQAHACAGRGALRDGPARLRAGRACR